ncbi:lysophospholipid acyltransferase family protein [Mucilaginibacter sp. UC70_90]
MGIFYRFEYEQPIDWSRPYIICPNHTSNLDISAMCILVKSNCCFMGKQELEDGLVTGLFFRTVDIPVNRDSKMSSFRRLKKHPKNYRRAFLSSFSPKVVFQIITPAALPV